MKKAKQESGLNPKNKRLIREDRRIDAAKARTPKLNTRLRDFKESKQKLIKALYDEGHRESALLLQNWDEMDANAEAMEKSISSTIKNWADDAAPAQAAKKVKVTSMKKMEDLAEAVCKSNAIKPFGENIYDSAANVKRKEKRLGEEVTGAGKNTAVKPYATSGASMQQAHELAQAKAQKKKTKASTKTMSDFSPEELEEMEAKRNMKKDEFNDKEAEKKKKQYKDINKPMPDPFDQNLKSNTPKKIKKQESTIGPGKEAQIDSMTEEAAKPSGMEQLKAWWNDE